MKTFNLAAMLMLLMVCNVKAQNDSVKQLKDQTLQEVEVVTTRPGTIKSRGLMNAATITSNELTKAACCNLGGSCPVNRLCKIVCGYTKLIWLAEHHYGALLF